MRRTTFNIILLLNIIVFNSTITLGQRWNKKNELKEEQTTEIFINQTLQKALRLNNDSTLKFGKKAIKLSDKNNYKYGQIKSRLIVGDYYKFKKNLIAINYLKEADSLLDNFKNDTLTAWASHSIARYYYYLKPIYSEALKFSYKAIDLYEKLDDKDNLCQVYSLCGMINSQQNQNKKAIEYYDKAIELAKEINDFSSVAYISNCISDIQINNKQYEEAKKYNNSALRIYDSLGEKGPAWGIAWTYAYTARIFFETAQIAWTKGDKTKAISLFQNAKTIYKKRIALELKIKSGSVDSYLDIANWYLHMIHLGQAPSVKAYVDTAKGYLKNCITNAKEVGQLSVLSNAYFTESVLDSIQGNFKAANENIDKYVKLQDSLNRQLKSQEAIRMEMQNVFKKEEATRNLEQLKKDAKHQIISRSLLVGLVVLSIISLIIFSQRNLVKKEKKKNDTLLLNILPSKIAKELKENGQVKANQFDEVSVLLVDFVGFTKTVANMEPKQLIKELNKYFTIFDKIMDKNGLEKIKTIGDAYLAVCGLPNENNNHAKCTIHAALEILEYIKLQKQKNIAFDVRIGINSGSVVAGIVGIKKFAYDIWGDTVNIAARMESSGVPGKVNISKATYDLVKNDEQFIFEARGKVATKGKGEVEMYFVENKNIETIKNL